MRAAGRWALTEREPFCKGGAGSAAVRLSPPSAGRAGKPTRASHPALPRWPGPGHAPATPPLRPARCSLTRRCRSHMTALCTRTPPPPPFSRNVVRRQQNEAAVFRVKSALSRVRVRGEMTTRKSRRQGRGPGAAVSDPVLVSTALSAMWPSGWRPDFRVSLQNAFPPFLSLA